MKSTGILIIFLLLSVKIYCLPIQQPTLEEQLKIGLEEVKKEFDAKLFSKGGMVDNMLRRQDSILASRNVGKSVTQGDIESYLETIKDKMKNYRLTSFQKDVQKMEIEDGLRNAKEQIEKEQFEKSIEISEAVRKKILVFNEAERHAQYQNYLNAVEYQIKSYMAQGSLENALNLSTISVIEAIELFNIHKSPLYLLIERFREALIFHEMHDLSVNEFRQIRVAFKSMIYLLPEVAENMKARLMIEQYLKIVVSKLALSKLKGQSGRKIGSKGSQAVRSGKDEEVNGTLDAIISNAFNGAQDVFLQLAGAKKSDDFKYSKLTDFDLDTVYLKKLAVSMYKKMSDTLYFDDYIASQYVTKSNFAKRYDSLLPNKILRETQRRLDTLKSLNEENSVIFTQETLMSLNALGYNLDTESLIELYPQLNDIVSKNRYKGRLNLIRYADYVLWTAFYSKREFENALPYALKLKENSKGKIGYIALIATYLKLREYHKAERMSKNALEYFESSEKKLKKNESLRFKIYLAEAYLGQKKYKNFLALEKEVSETDYSDVKGGEKGNSIQSMLNKMKLYKVIALSELGQHESASNLMISSIKEMNGMNWMGTMEADITDVLLPTKEVDDISLAYTPYVNLVLNYIATVKKDSNLLFSKGYDNILFYKELTINLERNLAANTIQKTDIKGQMLYKNWIDAREKAADVNFPRRDSIRDYINFYRNELIKGGYNNLIEVDEKTLPNWLDVKQNLSQKDVAIEFVTFKPYFFEDNYNEIKYGAFVLTKKMDHPVFVNLCSEQDIRSVLNKLAEKNSENNNEAEIINELYDQKSSEIYDLIFKPLEKYQKGAETIYYAPSGILHNISFAALKKNNLKKYLSEDFILHQVSSTKAVGSFENVINPKSVVLFGNLTYNKELEVEQEMDEISKDNTRSQKTSSWKSLPGTAIEISELNSFFQTNHVNTLPFTEHQGLEENFYKAVQKKPDIIHIATHAFYNRPTSQLDGTMSADRFKGDVKYLQEKDPLNSTGLIFAGANYFWSYGSSYKSNLEDGIVTANELASLDLIKNQLVTLSACETAIGNSQGNEGVFGLQRGLKLAGAKNLLLSLWKVDDKVTAEYMLTFYDYLIGKKFSMQQAYLNTQREIAKRYPDPYHWASFILIQ